MALIITQKIIEKLAGKHGIGKDEVEQCFANKTGGYLQDTREDHRSDPPTLWFIAETNFGRKLKVVFIFRDGDVHLRTAYTPNGDELCIYKKYGEGN